MKVHRELAVLLPVFKKAVITIGTFDGVHLGHRQIIRQLKQEAARIDGETVIITFHPHPRKIVASGNGNEIKLLNTLEEKITLLEAAGIDHLVIIPFDQYFADQTAEAYITHFLYRYFKPHTIIIGYDHRFGKERKGDYALLQQFASALGFIVKEIPVEVLNEVSISSTRIRHAIAENDIETANAYLGYVYFFEGLVTEGNKLGRTIGYPTANLQVGTTEKLIPGNGVYAVKVTLAKKEEYWNGMMNIGVRPTVDGTRQVVEVNIFDFDRTIYGQTLQVQVHRYMRGEVKFSGLDALKAQLGQDSTKARQLLAAF